MADECLCTHDFRCAFIVRSSGQFLLNADWDIAASISAGDAQFNVAQPVKNSSCAKLATGDAVFVAAAPDVIAAADANLSAGALGFDISPWSSLAHLIRGPRSPIVGNTTLTATPNVDFAVEPLVIGTRGKSFYVTIGITRGISAALVTVAGGTFNPQFQYSVKFPPPLLIPRVPPAADKTVGLIMAFAPTPSFAHSDDKIVGLEMLFKCRTTFTQAVLAGNLRAHFACTTKFGRETRVSINSISDDVLPNTGNIAPGATTNDATPRFNGSAEYDTVVAIAVNGYVLAVVPVNVNGRWTYTTPKLDDGTYGFSFAAYDENGYRSEVKTLMLTIDTTTPKPPLLLSVAALVDGNKIPVTAGADINSDTLFFTGMATPNMSVQASSAADWSTPLAVSPDGSWLYSTTVPDGEYTFLFRTVTASGNFSSSISFSVNVDTVPPEPPTISHIRDFVGPAPVDIEDGGLTNDPQPVFSGTTEPETAVIIRLNNRVFAKVYGENWTYKPPQLMNGNYKFVFTAEDKAKNESEPVEYSFTVDTLAPAPPHVRTINDDELPDVGLVKYGGTTNDTTPTFSGIRRPDQKIYFAVDSGSRELVATAEDSVQWSYTPATPLTAGRRIIQFFAEDLAGNMSQPRSIVLTIQTTPPVTQPLQMRPVLAVDEEPPEDRWELIAIVDHPVSMALSAQTTLEAPLVGPGGILTRVTRKKKLRLLRAEHPDSEPENKKYIWRFPVADENLSCGCEFIHIGIYDLRCGSWPVNTEREVRLLIADILYQDVNPAGGEVELVATDMPTLYPQYNEDGTYRVVKVLNKMYDIHPPSVFTRTEPVYDNYEDRTFINTEIPRLVFVYEGCGESFFLINAECD